MLNNNENNTMDKPKHDSVKFLCKLSLATKLQNAQEEKGLEASVYLEKVDKEKPDWWAEKLKNLVKNKKIAYKHIKMGTDN